MKLLAAFLMALTITCVSPGGQGGFLFNSYSGPFQATSNGGRGKTGEASVYCVLALACIGDASISKASSEANLSKVASIDYHYLSVFGFVFNKTTIIVTGE